MKLLIVLSLSVLSFEIHVIGLTFIINKIIVDNELSTDTFNILSLSF